jgi:hypothetical protein
MTYRTFTITALALSSFIFLSVFSAARSQAQEPGAERAQKIAQVLNLSPQQQSQLTPIIEAEAPKVQAIAQDTSLSADEKVKKLKAVHAQTDPLVKNILTPTQYKQWQTIRKDELANINIGH